MSYLAKLDRVFMSIQNSLVAINFIVHNHKLDTLPNIQFMISSAIYTHINLSPPSIQ
jgi:hypothetical protein